VDAVQGSDGAFYNTSCERSTHDSWKIRTSGEPDGEYAQVGAWAWWSNQKGYIVIQPTGPVNWIKVYIQDDGRSAKPVYGQVEISADFYKATLGSPTHGPDFTLDEGGYVTGRVVTPDGDPIKWFNIDPSVITANGNIHWPKTYTDALGYFTLHSLHAGIEVYLHTSEDEGSEQDSIVYSSGLQCLGPFVLSPGEEQQAPTITLLAAATLTGTVTDEDGLPVAGAEIEVDGTDINGNVTEFDTSTDENGVYRTDVIPPGICTVRGCKEGFLCGKTTDVVIPEKPPGDPNVVTADLVMMHEDEGASIAGQITNFDTVRPKDPDGLPLPLYDDHAWESYGLPSFGIIGVNMDDFQLPDIERSFLDDAYIEDGYADYFEIDPAETPGKYGVVLPPGNVGIFLYEFYSFKPGYEGSIVIHDWRQWTLSKGQILTDQDLTVRTDTGALKGNVITPEGYERQGTKWCSIWVFNEDPAWEIPIGNGIGRPSVTDTYEIRNLPAGTYTVVGYARELDQATYTNITINVGQETTLDVVFEYSCTGDVNGDGEITPQDALCAFETYLGICPTSCGIACEDVCCDVTQDADCTPADALCIFQKYLGLPGCMD